MKEKKWELIHRAGVKAFGYEIYQNNQNIERFLIKIFIYNTPVLLSGDKEIITNKVAELKEVLEEIQEFFPENNTLPF